MDKSLKYIFVWLTHAQTTKSNNFLSNKIKYHKITTQTNSQFSYTYPRITGYLSNTPLRIEGICTVYNTA